MPLQLLLATQLLLIDKDGLVLARFQVACSGGVEWCIKCYCYDQAGRSRWVITSKDLEGREDEVNL